MALDTQQISTNAPPPQQLALYYEKTTKESKANEKKKTTKADDNDSWELTKEQKKALEKIIYMMLAILVKAQSEISHKLQEIMGLDNDMEKGVLRFLETFTNKAIRELKKMLVELEKQEHEQKIMKVFSIIGAIAGCVIGFALGGLPGLLMGVVLAGLTLSGEMSKIQMGIAKGISHTKKGEQPPAWAQAVSGIIITAATIFLSFGASGLSAALETGISSVTTTATETVTEQVAEQEMVNFAEVGEQEAGQDVANEANELEQNEEVAAPRDQDQPQGTNKTFKERFKANFKKSYVTTAKMSALQVLGSTNTLGSLWTSFLELCKVNKEDAEIWGQVLGMLTLFIAGYASMRNAQMPESLVGTKAFPILMRSSIAVAGICMIAQGACQILIGESQLKQADAEKKYGEAKGAISIIDLYAHYNHSSTTMNVIKQINGSYRSIYRTIPSFSVVANTVAQELLA